MARLKLPTAKNYGVTRADFPEQDWSVWEARKYSHPGLGQTVDTSYRNTWPCCIHCATWICSSCWDFRRQRADRKMSQYCAKCGGREGFFSAVRHGTRNPHTPDGSHLPKLPFVVPVISTVGAQWDILGMISYYKDLAIRNSGRAQLWENPVKDNMTEAEADAHREILTAEEAVGLSEGEAREQGFLPPKQVDPEEARGWGVSQPDELEHRDPGYSCDTKKGQEALSAKDELEKLGNIQRPDRGEAKYPFVNDRGDTVLGPDTMIEPNENVVWVGGRKFIRYDGEEIKRRFKQRLSQAKPLSRVIENLIDRYQEALANNCQPTDKIAISIGEVEQLILSKFTEYPHEDGDSTVLGPEIFAVKGDEAIAWKGVWYHKTPEPQDSVKVVSEPSWQQREALEFAIRVAAPASSIQRPVDRVAQVLETADKILEWLQK